MSLQHALLGLLNYSDMTGYDLKKMFDESISNFWYASVSQIYRELNMLEKNGFLSSVIKPQADRPDRRVYSITEKGKASFYDWMRNFPEKFSREKRDEFSLRIFFGSVLTEEQLLQEFEQLIGEKRKQLKEVDAYRKLKEEYRQKIPLVAREEKFLNYIFRHAEMSLQATIAWAEDCIEDLKKE
jgi:PadR family transcriptional regulator, regulatory protein AphA